MVSYGKSLQTNLAKIQKPMQRALVPIASLIRTAMKGEMTPLKSWLKSWYWLIL